MASVDKKSLRDEFATLEAQFEQLSSEGEITPASRALFQALLMLVRVMMAVFMEKTTKKDNRNSSLPSSQTQKDDTSTTQAGSKRKGGAQNDAVSANTRTIETTECVEVDTCETCGEDLTDTPCQQQERRTLIDLIFEKVVEHVDVQIKQCPTCDAVTKGAFPVEMAGPLQYGMGIKAYMLDLLIAQMVSLNRIQKSIKSLIGQLISEATLLNYVLQLHLALEKWEQSAIEALRMMPCIHVDETSMKINKKNQWVHVYASGEITLKFLQAGRGKEAIDDIGIIPRYGGVIIHDCLPAYLTYGKCRHGLCGSHLLRELQFVIDSNGYAWANNMKRLLQQTCAKVSRRKRKRLTEKEYLALQKRYRNILTRGEKELPPIPAKPSGKRGRVAKSDAHNLWERLNNYEQAVLLFARDSNVAFTNNRAERDLRMNKVKQKVSGCFRVERYARAYCRISSYLKTMANKGINPLIAIQMALTGQIYSEGGE